jgi:hypothetical protein
VHTGKPSFPSSIRVRSAIIAHNTSPHPKMNQLAASMAQLTTRSSTLT